jgi:uncharacterized tellurite resistance protein B-like protein
VRKYLLVLLCLFNAQWAFAERVDSLLVDLYQVVEKQDAFEKEKLATIYSLKSQQKKVESTEEMFGAYDALYQAYQSYQFDSAFSYASKLIDLGYQMKDEAKVAYGKVQLGFILLSSGMYKETYDTLSTVNSQLLSKKDRIEFYALMSRAYYDLIDYNRDNYYTDYYQQLGSQYVDSTIMISPPASYESIYLKGLKYLRNRDFGVAEAELLKLIDRQNEITPHQFAITASTLAFIHLSEQDTVPAIRLLVQAAISDVKTATKETSAMMNLAEVLFQLGEIDHADFLIQKAMEDANFYGAKQRRMQVGAIQPIIASAKLAEVESERRLLILYGLGITLIVIIIAFFSYVISKQYKKLKKADAIIKEANDNLRLTISKLEESDKIKDEYIGYYFNINSEYLAKLEKLKKEVDRKLMQKKFGEIGYVINTIHLKSEREKLYESFDHIFLKLFPNFLHEFNALFNEEDQIKLTNDDLLNTELRIFALIRMGITDSDKIASILNYSVNTIYAYKNRVKSKSKVPNEQFEYMIMKIKAE